MDQDTKRIVASNLAAAYFQAPTAAADATTGYNTRKDKIDAIFEIYQAFLSRLSPEGTGVVAAPSGSGGADLLNNVLRP